MEAVNPEILTIAGFDPSAGAGILADVKVCEAHDVYSMGVCSAITIQNDLSFDEVEWIKPKTIIKQIEILTNRFNFDYVKIGLIENLQVLDQITDVLLRENVDIKIIWDPITGASAGFEFHKNLDPELLEKVLQKIYLITPNLNEIKVLMPDMDADDASKKISTWCNVFLKGGHSDSNMSIDILYEKSGSGVSFEAMKFENVEKHGSGCALSTAIACNLSKGMDLADSCAEAKAYVTDFLISARGLLGVHKKTQKI
jgi:hydroxymethylpyrimidine/phosphomethylpyrimidine kinase